MDPSKEEAHCGWPPRPTPLRGMACFDSKYTDRFWRPITAIHNADLDGNAETTANTGWSPLTTTPNHPEYPSQHGCVTSALAQVLARAVGTDEIDATVWGVYWFCSLATIANFVTTSVRLGTSSGSFAAIRLISRSTVHARDGMSLSVRPILQRVKRSPCIRHRF